MVLKFRNDVDYWIATQRGGVPIRVEIEKWRILPVGCSTTNRPPGKAAAGGMRHGEEYQEVGAAA
jgi:hypothetical protein